MGRDIAELASAQVAAPAAHGEKRERITQCNAERGAERAERRSLEQHETRDVAACEAQHAE